MESALIGLIGVVFGTLLSATAGSVLSHRGWVREASLGAYTEYLAAMQQIARGFELTPGDAEAAFARALIVASSPMDGIAVILTKAAWATRNDPGDQGLDHAYNEAAGAFAVQAHKEVTRWRFH